MRPKVTIKPNPAPQKRNYKILEVSFTDSKGDYSGCLISLMIYNDQPVVNVYQIDEKILVNVSEKREKQF